MNYVYIQAIVYTPRLDLEGPDAIKFRSTIIDAKDTEDAYAKGGRWSDQFIRGRTEIMNDFVVCIGGEVLL